MPLTGSQFLEQIWNLTGEPREQAVVDAIFSGYIPENLKRGWPVIESSGVVGGRERKIRYLATSDYLGVGTADDFIYTPQWPGFAQTVANAFQCILPSSRIVEQITRQAVVRVPLQIPPIARPVSPRMESTEAWAQDTVQIRQVLRGTGKYSPGVLVAGEKKDVVVGPGLDGRVAIFGGLRDDLRSFWQPYSTVHPSDYSDYSHGIRLIHRDAWVDGNPVDLVDVFRDPVLSGLVSSQGPFNPIYPTTPAPAAFRPQKPNFQLAASVPRPTKAELPEILKFGLLTGLGYAGYRLWKKYFG